MKKELLLKSLALFIVVLFISVSCSFAVSVENNIINQESSSHNELLTDTNKIYNMNKHVNYSNRYAVLLEGVLYGYPSLYYSYLSAIQRIYWTLNIKYGFNDEDIYVLSTHKGFEEPEFWDPTIIDYKSNNSNLQLVLDILKNKMNSEDLLYFFPVTFGNGWDPSFSTASDKVYLSDFNNWINGIQGQMVFIFSQVGSNYFINYLSEGNRIIGTSVNNSQPNEGWVEHYIMGLIGFADSTPEVGNQDGIVSIEESHHYVSWWLYNKYPWRWSLLDDNGDDKGHHYKDEDGYNISDPSKDGYYAARTFLGGEIMSTPPNIPDRPIGPLSGRPNTKYIFTINTTDPEEDPIIYGLDWDNDEIVDGWTELYDSGRKINITHSWSKTGTYNIRVKAKDIHGYNSNWSDELTVTIWNNNPKKPKITGWKLGKVGNEYNYTFVATDPDADNISYFVDWGDNTSTEWIGPHYSGKRIKTSHQWSEQGTYIIKAKTKDIYGGESDWATLTVSMPRNKIFNKPLTQFLQQHLNIFPIIQKLLQRLG